MLWLIWQMWFFLAIAFLIGLGLGWRLWSSSGVAGKALQDARDEIGRLQRENDSLTKTAARHQAALDAQAKEETAKPEASAAKKSAAEKASKDGASASADDLTAIKGVGPKAAAALEEAGITTFAQIAAWTRKDVSDWDAKLNSRGRIERDDWVGQAKAKSG
ncbi:helix-hairpin-helix domain-containing protein [Hyphobacterium sp.]|uniref:helix-hairpin-helix domain-containing protein n=1 Tax=Hyphobacterium sp. TaxID=2004662 RepID=UPI003BAA62E2